MFNNPSAHFLVVLVMVVLVVVVFNVVVFVANVVVITTTIISIIGIIIEQEVSIQPYLAISNYFHPFQSFPAIPSHFQSF